MPARPGLPSAPATTAPSGAQRVRRRGARHRMISMESGSKACERPQSWPLPGTKCVRAPCCNAVRSDSLTPLQTERRGDKCSKISNEGVSCLN
eukprot:9371355-Pyramimonas_sp.AAC.1